ncbi:hypothetical protein [Natrialba sp. PRR66]|uniref:hypothetical protein n=1 Tax=Natrialba sp. PRR66 TaxID=3098146 RepID=UPI002B1CEDD9|nr:hypothetical protein [Natrialba sp. PRR66]
MVWDLLVTAGSKVSGFVVRLGGGYWRQRKLAKQLHTQLYRIVHDRPEMKGHPPRFYEKTADNLDQAVETGLFSTDELEYLADRLAAYCRAKQNGQTAKSVVMDKSFLEWTRSLETEGMSPFDVSEIEKRLREDIEGTYRLQRFEHPVDED